MKLANPILLAPLAAFTLAGCVSLTPDLPESMLVLTPTAQAPAGSGGAATAAEAIAVLEPEAPAKLNVLRVPVQVDASNIAYLKDALWVEKPARLFRRLLAETIRVKSSKMVVDGDEPGLAADTRLRGTLLENVNDEVSLRLPIGSDLKLPRGDVSELFLLFRARDLKPGDGVILKSRSGNEYRGSVRSLVAGRRLVMTLTNGGEASLRLSKIDLSSIMVPIPIPLDSLSVAG